MNINCDLPGRRLISLFKMEAGREDGGGGVVVVGGAKKSIPYFS